MGECIHLPQAPHGVGSIDPMGRAGQTLPGAAAPLFLWDVPCKGPQSSIKAAFPKAPWMGLVGAARASQAAAGIQPGRGCAGGCGPDVTQQRLQTASGLLN